MGTPWQEYLEWNNDVALSLYPELSEPRMVFLDLEGDALRQVAERRGIHRDEVVPALVAVVRKTLDPTSRKSAFAQQSRATELWQLGNRLDPPPGLGLLALFSLAAERMQQSDGLADHNYYGQLARVLESNDTETMSLSYRNSSTALWDSLSAWLDQNEGRRGFPVDFTVGHHEFIGRAKAQALVRDTDRRRLESFFTDFDLAPHSEMTADQLEPLLHVWLSSSTAPRHLTSLWQEETLRSALVEAVREFLLAWDGVVSESDSTGGGAKQIRLTLARRSGLRKGWALSLVLRLPRPAEGRSATLHGVEGDIQVGLTPMGRGELRIPDLKNLLEPGQLVSGTIHLTDPVAGRVSRSPRSTVVLRRDEMSADWVEVSQVRLGDQVAVLARDDQDLDAVLEEVSGTSWTEIRATDTSGLPDGWKLMEGITVVGMPSGDYSPFHDLYALVPITDTAFSAAGGIRLPGAGREWRFHAGRAPTLTVAHPGKGFTVHLLDLEEDVPQPLDAFQSEAGDPLVISLADQDLDTGAYGLRVTDGTSPGIERAFWLHDSAYPVPGIEEVGLSHGLDDPLWAICADNDPTGTDTVQGLPLFGLDEEDLAASSTLIPATPWWRRDRNYVRGQDIVIDIPGPDSCVYTGRHFEHIATAVPDEQGFYRGTSLGVCEGCGRTKRYNNSYKKNYRRWLRTSGALVQGRDHEPPVRRIQALGTDLDWNLLLDSLVAIGGGDVRDLRRVTQQFDPSARFFHEVVATLSDLGHLEVSRDRMTAEVTRWETSLTAVAEVAGDSVLAGHWPRDFVAELDKNGAGIRREPQVGAPDRVVATSPELIGEVIPDALVLHEPGLTLAAALPPLSTVISALPRVPMPSTVLLDRYNPAGDVWQTVASAEEPGAYRTGGYSRTYLLRTREDMCDGLARVVNVGLAKHAVAVLQPGSRPLLAYDRQSRALTVPLGARLPEMYARAATLSSGRAAQRWDGSDHGSLIAYRDVPETVAQVIYHAMGA